MSLYLIKLKPLGDFFFGGENTFGKSGNDENERSEYLVNSLPFPQQTSLLGMIRKELLIQSGVYKDDFKSYTDEDKKIMAELIGKNSFNIKPSDVTKDQDFGKIKGISPVFIMNDRDEIIITLPKDQSYSWNENNESEKYIPFRLEEITTGQSNLSGKKLYYLKTANGTKYKSKEGIVNKFVNINTEEIVDVSISCDNKDNYVFIPVSKVGNQKNNHENNNKDKGFYKINSFKLNPKMEFSFVVNCDFDIQNSLVNLGGIQSTFKMTTKKLDEDSIDIWIDKEIGKSEFFSKIDDSKIVSISPCFLNRDINDFCDFAITETIEFRNMISVFDKKRKMKYIEYKYNFIDKGSVFFIQKEGNHKIDKLIMKNKYMKQIGYNYFIKGDYNYEK